MAELNEILDPTLNAVFFMLTDEKYINDFLKPLCLSIASLSADEVAEITIVDPRIQINSPDETQGTVDVRIRTHMGTTIHIEIQRRYFKNLPVRTSMQHSKLYGMQYGVGHKYDKVCRTITLLITKFRIFEDEKYFCRYCMANPLSGQVFDDNSEIYALVLSQLPKESDNTPAWAWGKFFKAKTKEELDMLAQDNPIIQRAVAILKDLSKDEAVRWQAEKEMTAQLDQMDWEDTIREEAENKGIKKGIKKGMELGEQKAARAMYKHGISVADIAFEFDRTVQEIEKWIEQ